MGLGLALLAGALSLLGVAAFRRRRCPDQLSWVDLFLAFVALFWGSGVVVLLAQGGGGEAPAGQPPSDQALLLGSGVGAGFAALVALVRAPASALGLRGASAGWMVRALVALPVFLVLGQLWGLGLEQAGVSLEEQELVGLLRELSGTWAGALALAYALVGAPVFEELLFRGLGLAALRPRLGTAGAALLTALLFGVLHGADPQAVPPLFALGLGLAWLRLRSGSLLPPLLLHAANNGIVVLALLLEGAPL